MANGSVSIKRGEVLSSVRRTASSSSPNERRYYRYQKPIVYFDVREGWPEGAQITLPDKLYKRGGTYTGFRLNKPAQRDRYEIAELINMKTGTRIYCAGYDLLRYFSEGWCQYPVYGYHSLENLCSEFEHVQRARARL